jgi:hypothetical protein
LSHGTIASGHITECKSDLTIQSSAGITNNGTLKIGDDLIINSGTYTDNGTTEYNNNSSKIINVVNCREAAEVYLIS